MRNKPNLRIETYRIDGRPHTRWGAFVIPQVSGDLRIISSGVDHDHGWEHVSVSLADRCPTWEEMCKVKDLFFKEDETVVQFHPRKSQYVKVHPYVLHLWRKLGEEFELPPSELI